MLLLFYVYSLGLEVADGDVPTAMHLEFSSSSITNSPSSTVADEGVDDVQPFASSPADHDSQLQGVICTYLFWHAVIDG